MREKLIDIVECYADFLDWDTKEDMVDSIMEKCFATDNNVGDKWISVKDRLPEKHDRYLVLTPSPFGHKAYTPWLAWYEPEVGFIDSDPEYGDLEMDDVTHWMPLPEPPKGE